MVSRPLQTTLALTIAFAAHQVVARQEFVARIPNGANVPGVQALGHVNPAGDGPRNAFGKAFEEAGYAWTTELCQADSDGDGQTNGQELGDPCCQFVVGSNEQVSWTDGVSHPGDAKSKSDESLWMKIMCNASSGSTSTVASGSFSSSVDSSTEADAQKASPTPTPTESSARKTTTAATITTIILTTLVSAIV